nr:PAS domain S-box protein [Desulfobacterales bacterium]
MPNWNHGQWSVSGRRRPWEKSDEKFLTIFRESLNALMIADCNSQEIFRVNQTAQHILGYECEFLVGSHFSIIFPLRANYQ